jgi:hypothetical protein
MALRPKPSKRRRCFPEDDSGLGKSILMMCVVTRPSHVPCRLVDLLHTARMFARRCFQYTLASGLSDLPIPLLSLLSMFDAGLLTCISEYVGPNTVTRLRSTSKAIMQPMEACPSIPIYRPSDGRRRPSPIFIPRRYGLYSSCLYAGPGL